MGGGGSKQEDGSGVPVQRRSSLFGQTSPSGSSLADKRSNSAPSPTPLGANRKSGSSDSAFSSDQHSPKSPNRASGVFALGEEKPINVDNVMNTNMAQHRKELQLFVDAALPEHQQAWQEHLRDLRLGRYVASALREGMKAPDFELTDQKGNSVRLSALLSKGPVVIVFLRGNWCPFCNEYIQRLQQALPSFQRLRASIVAISPETSECVKSKYAPLVTFSVCSDANFATSKAYGLIYDVPESVVKMYMREYPDQFAERFAPLAPGEKPHLQLTPTYTVDPDGIISYSFVDWDWTKRAPIMQLVQTLSWQL